MNLSEILTSKAVFDRVAGGEIPCPDLTTKEEYSASDRWRIFSRIRFEYVRPTCTLRSQSVPCVCPSMPERERDYGLKEYIKAGLDPDRSMVAAFKSAIEKPAEGSLAHGLKRYYQQNGVPIPGADPSLFPASYIIVHDLHHVLLGSSVSQKGEMEVISFESGMLHRSEAPILLLEQMEIFFSDFTDALDSATLVKAWNSGKNADSLFEDWQWQHELDQPLELIRNKYGVLPLR